MTIGGRVPLQAIEAMLREALSPAEQVLHMMKLQWRTAAHGDAGKALCWIRGLHCAVRLRVQEGRCLAGEAATRDPPGCHGPGAAGGRLLAVQAVIEVLPDPLDRSGDGAETDQVALQIGSACGQRHEGVRIRDDA